jgi:methyltransferase (TIGR00027 family)
MQGEQPSVTAIAAAAYRAAHQKFEDGNIFFDPFARMILGEEASLVADGAALDPSSRMPRLLIAARSRFAEDAISNAVARGVCQVVVLGAGLDTFSLRNPYATAGVRVFEVDHPATQAWKRERLALAGLNVRPSVAFVSVDFQRHSLAECLAIGGFDATATAFFVWLGVVTYLEKPEIMAILRFISEIPEAEVVFDYMEPVENHLPEQRALVAAWHETRAACGEPWLSHFDPAELTRELRDLGFVEIEDIDPVTLVLRYFGTPKEKVRSGSHMIRAKLLGRGEDAITAYDDVLARFGAATELPLHELVANALFNKGVTLGVLGRAEDAITAYDDVLARFGAAAEFPLRRLVANALVNKGVALAALGRSEDAIAACEDVLARFGAATEFPLRELAAKALFIKGVTLGALGRAEDAIAAYDDVLARFGAAAEFPLRGLVANALVNKGVALAALGRSEDAIAAYEDVLARFGAAAEFPLRELVANALANKGVALAALGRSEDAIAACEDVLARFGVATELPLRELVAKRSSIRGSRSVRSAAPRTRSRPMTICWPASARRPNSR